MICKYCLTKIDDDSVFCESCGQRVAEAGNNEETQLIPKVEEKVIPSRSEAFAANGGRPPERDFSKLLAEIYDDEDPETEPEEVIEEPAEEAPEETGTEAKEEWLSPDVQLPAEPEPPAQVFCMACGRKLPEGAAFCDQCGTATGEVGNAGSGRSRAKEPVVLPILKEYFVRPASALEKAASGQVLPLGAGVLLIKDILIALISALSMDALDPLIGGSRIMSADAFGFGAKVFLIMLLADLILLGLVFGTGIVFKAAGTFKETAAVCGTAFVLPSLLWIITLILTAFAPQVCVPAAAVSLTVTTVFTGKAIAAAGKTDENKIMYMTAVVMAVYVAVIYGGLTWMIA